MNDRSPIDSVPICLPCWRERFGLECDAPPPPPGSWRMESCIVCERPTNAGLYLLRGEAADVPG